jgi:hypothetical protein
MGNKLLGNTQKPNFFPEGIGIEKLSMLYQLPPPPPPAPPPAEPPDELLTLLELLDFDGGVELIAEDILAKSLFSLSANLSTSKLRLES